MLVFKSLLLISYFFLNFALGGCGGLEKFDFGQFLLMRM